MVFLTSNSTRASSTAVFVFSKKRVGIGRAIGEAMAVMMVAGNSPNMPDSPFRSVTFLTTAIAKEMSYAGGLQRQALFSIALVLFVFIMIINVVLNVVLKGGSRDE